MNNNNVLGFDVGTKFIGVAIGNLLIKKAQKLLTIEKKSKKYFWLQIEELIKKWQPEVLVIGNPLTTDGKSQEMTELVNKLTKQLQGRFNIKTILVDERLTTKLAQDIIRQEKTKMSKQLVDQTAAQIILQTWFDEL